MAEQVGNILVYADGSIGFIQQQSSGGTFQQKPIQNKTYARDYYDDSGSDSAYFHNMKVDFGDEFDTSIINKFSPISPSIVGVFPTTTLRSVIAKYYFKQTKLSYIQIEIKYSSGGSDLGTTGVIGTYDADAQLLITQYYRIDLSSEGLENQPSLGETQIAICANFVENKAVVLNVYYEDVDGRLVVSITSGVAKDSVNFSKWKISSAITTEDIAMRQLFPKVQQQVEQNSSRIEELEAAAKKAVAYKDYICR